MSSKYETTVVLRDGDGHILSRWKVYIEADRDGEYEGWDLMAAYLYYTADNKKTTRPYMHGTTDVSRNLDKRTREDLIAAAIQDRAEQIDDGDEYPLEPSWRDPARDGLD